MNKKKLLIHEFILNLTDTKFIFTTGTKTHKKVVKFHNEGNYEGLELNPLGGKTLAFVRPNEIKIIISVGDITEYSDSSVRAMWVHELSHAVSEYMEHYKLYEDEFRSILIQTLMLEVEYHMKQIKDR